MFTVDYKHRSWNHICWVANFKNNEHTLFYNGNKIGTKKLGMKTSVNSFQGYPNQTKQFLVLGQEPDEFKGGFTRDQVFEGKISRFNWWNYTLEDIVIGDIASCTDNKLGNFVSWNEDFFIIDNLKIIRGVSSKEFCATRETWLFFPGRRTRDDAEDLCGAHGGRVVVPRSPQENKKVQDMYNIHKDQCRMPHSDIDMVGWLGVVSVSRKTYISKFGNILYSSKYTNVTKR